MGLQVHPASGTWSWLLDRPGSVMFHVMICALYCVTVECMKIYVKSQSTLEKPYKPSPLLIGIMKWHNIALSIVSLAMGISFVLDLRVEGRFNSWHSMSCRNTDNTGNYGIWTMVYLLSKIWEWADTYFLILQGREVISLHYFHHMTTFTMAALCHNFPVGGFSFVNCFVHAIMYAYYSNPRPFRWARQLITSGQLLQFCLVISIHTYGFLQPKGACFEFQEVRKEWWYCQSVVVGYFLLFVKFFYDNYIAASAAKAKKVVKAE